MESKKSWLKLSSVQIPDTKLSIRIPTVGEILENEQNYYNIISSLTASPYQYMVQLNDVFHIDYTTITDYDLFKMLFSAYLQSDLSIIFGDLNISDFQISKHDDLFSPNQSALFPHLCFQLHLLISFSYIFCLSCYFFPLDSLL